MSAPISRKYILNSRNKGQLILRKMYPNLLSSFFYISAYGQGESQKMIMLDSLLQKSYDELALHFNALKSDFSRAEPYAKAYFQKSIAESDTK